LHVINLLSITTSEGAENKRKIISQFVLGHGRLFFNPGNILILLKNSLFHVDWRNPEDEHAA